MATSPALVSASASTMPIVTFTFSTSDFARITGQPVATAEYTDPDGDHLVSSSTSVSSSGPSRSTQTAIHSASGPSGYAGQYISSENSLANNGIYTDFSTYIDPATISPLGNGTSSTAEESDGAATQPGRPGGLSPAALVSIGVVIGLLALGTFVGCCLYRRRRRRVNKLPGGRRDETGVSRRKSRRAKGMHPDDKWEEIDIEVPALPSPTSPTSANTLLNSRLSHRDLRHIILSRPPPALSPTSASTLNLASPFIDPPSGLDRAQSRRTESTYTDNTEYDMLAQDGSSYARTLSTYSEGVNSEYSERDLGYVPPLSATTPSATATAATSHSGRTVGAAVDGDKKDPNGPSSTGTGTGTWTGTYTSAGGWTHLSSSAGGLQPHSRPLTPMSSTPGVPSRSTSSATRPLLSISPFSDPPAEVDVYPLQHSSPVYQSGIPDSPASSRSWRTEDEALFRAGAGAGSLRSLDATTDSRNRGTMRRGLTIVRHVDGGAISPSRGDGEGEDEGEQGQEPRGEMHFPPSYGDLYPAR